MTTLQNCPEYSFTGTLLERPLVQFCRAVDQVVGSAFDDQNSEAVSQASHYLDYFTLVTRNYNFATRKDQLLQCCLVVLLVVRLLVSKTITTCCSSLGKLFFGEAEKLPKLPKTPLASTKRLRQPKSVFLVIHIQASIWKQIFVTCI